MGGGVTVYTPPGNRWCKSPCLKRQKPADGRAFAWLYGRLQLQLNAQLVHGVLLDLADALGRNTELLGQFM